ncbi:MAG: DUF72 domain-containing protein [Gemmatimonadetes bacterium]|nr:DUF72 domain-containing protein [Gemmatimonadota bacterium]
MASPQGKLDPGLVRFGTASFSSKDWVGPFYPDGTRPAEFLTYYAKHFDTVEVDATYYAVPDAKVVDGWVAKTPDTFRFAAKFPRTIVHAGGGPMPDADVLLTEATYPERDDFLDVMSRLGDRLGVLLLQFPYFSRNAFATEGDFLERLDEFLTDLPADFQYAVEIRNRAWISPDFAHLCRSHDATMVLVDQGRMPHGDEVEEKFDVVTSDLAYVRLLGDRKEIEAITQQWDVEVIDRRERLQRWANFLVRSVRRGVPTVVYVNNHYAGHAPTTTRRLQEMFDASLQKNAD